MSSYFQFLVLMIDSPSNIEETWEEPKSSRLLFGRFTGTRDIPKITTLSS